MYSNLKVPCRCNSSGILGSWACVQRWKWQKGDSAEQEPHMAVQVVPGSSCGESGFPGFCRKSKESKVKNRSFHHEEVMPEEQWV